MERCTFLPINNITIRTQYMSVVLNKIRTLFTKHRAQKYDGLRLVILKLYYLL